MCRHVVATSRRFLSEALSLGRDLRYPPLREVVKLTLLAVVAIAALMLLVHAMDLGFYRLLVKHSQ